MDRNLAIFAALILLLIAINRLPNSSHKDERPGTLKYQGQEIRLRKEYSTYEAYKDDPYNLDTNDLLKIEQLITDAPVPALFKTREELVHAVVKDLKFPGYGLGFSDGMKQADGSILETVEIEIPQRDKNRLLVFRTARDQIRLVDSIVTNWAFGAGNPTSNLEVKVDGSKLLYVKGGEILRSIPLPAQDSK
jgi:hypothetical protein